MGKGHEKFQTSKNTTTDKLARSTMQMFFVGNEKIETVKYARAMVFLILAMAMTPGIHANDQAEGFWDDLMRMLPPNSSGVVVAVDGNETVMFKTFGNLSVSSDTRVDNNTFFRPGSLGESIIAILVMHLVETGKLNLTAPIALYLNDTVPIAPAFGTNITVRHLLEHRAGYENLVFGNWVEDEKGVIPLDKFLRKRLPKVIWKPGEVLATSSVNYALLSLILENVTGIPFSQYAKETFFDKMGMSNSGFSQTYPQGSAVVGYTPHGGIIERNWVNLFPTFGFYTTPTDFLRLVRTFAQGVPWILKQQTFAMMTKQGNQSYALGNYLLGFAEEYINGTRINVKIGGTRGFSSAVYFDADVQQGLGIIVNHELGVSFNQVIRYFWRHVYPEKIQSISLPKYVPEGFFALRKYTGIYRDTDFIRTTFEKSLMISTSPKLRRDPLEIGVNTEEDNLVTEFSLFDKEHTYKWKQVNQTLFVQENSTEFLQFIEMDGKIYLYTTLFGMPKYFEKIPFLQADTTQFGLLVFAEAIFMIAFLSVFLVPRFRKTYLDRKMHFIDRLPYSIMIQSGTLNLVFPFLFDSITSTLPQKSFVTGIPLGVKAILLLPIVSIFLFLTFSTYLWVMRRNLGDKRQQMFYLAYWIGNVTYIYVLANLNLIGFHY